jgi:uncharacterized membrane protein YciS (DUF1049 family)
MNKKTLTMILAVLLIVGFFLPYISASLFSMKGFSGLDLIKGVGKADKYVLLLSPIAGLLLLAGAANNGNYILSKGVLVLLALIGVLYMPIRGLIDGVDLGKLFQSMGIGYWLSLVSCILLALYNPKN